HFSALPPKSLLRNPNKGELMPQKLKADVSAEVKLCKDCKWSHRTISGLLSWGYATCRNPQVMQKSYKIGEYLVAGKTEGFCSVERGGDYEPVYPCGTSGRLFEAKNAKALDDKIAAELGVVL